MIQLQRDFEYLTTSVPNLFIDEYMAEANGEFVKVYLYLLRCTSGHMTECSICAIADHCGHTENDVLRALRYWERVGLVKLTCDSDSQVCSILMCAPHATNREKSEDNSASVSSSADSDNHSSSNGTGNRNITAFRMKQASSPKEYTADEVDEFRKDPNVCELFYVIEMYLKRPLGSADTNTILYWYDQLHFTPDLICYLVEYCISKGHSNLRYMDKVAMGWKDAGIATIDQAKEYAAAHSKAYYAVMKAFGINGRSLTGEETAFVTRWTKEYGFDLNIVLEACRRTMSAIHQPSFEYADAILTDWQKNHVHTIDDIQSLDKAYAKAKKHTLPAKEATGRSNKFNNFTQREYNYEQLEQYLLNTTVQ